MLGEALTVFGVGNQRAKQEGAPLVLGLLEAAADRQLDVGGLGRGDGGADQLVIGAGSLLMASRRWSSRVSCQRQVSLR